MSKNLISNPGRALVLTAKLATAAASRNSKQALSTLPELITFFTKLERVFTLVNLFNLCYINGPKMG